MQGAYIAEIATTAPGVGIRQTDALEFMLTRLTLDAAQRDFLRKVYAGTAIETRHSVAGDFSPGGGVAGLFAGSDPSTAARNALFASESNKLAAEVLGKLLARADIAARRITHLVTATCTGFAAPGFDCHVAEALGLDPAVPRYNIGFMGCFAAFPALRLADHICRSQPGSAVAVINLELCTLHFSARTDRETLVTQSLFSDGASAALVTSEQLPGRTALYRLDRFGTMLLPGSAKDMTWTLGDHGFQMGLSAAVPKFIESHIGEVVDRQCAAGGILRDDIRHWAIHPGGRAILDRIEGALPLPQGSLDVSRKVLRENGNMSSATVMFVLAEIAQASKCGAVFSAAFGPGMTVESALLERL